MANQEVAEKKSSSGPGFLEPVRDYLRETLGELRKVHWPTRTDVRNLTTVVLAATFIMAAFLGLFDFLFGRLIEEILLSNIVAIAVAVVIVLSIIVLVVFASRDRR